MKRQDCAKKSKDQKLLHIYSNQVKQNIDSLLKGENKEIWTKSLTNELGRLSQGITNVKGNYVVEFFKKSEVPKNRKVTYSNMICDYKPLKKEKHRVRLTIGGDKLEYFGDTTSPAASLLETKLLINSTISDSNKGARFMTLDIKDFFCKHC